MSRDDVRANLASWEADSEGYQQRNAEQLNRWDRLAWGVWDLPEDEVGALGDVEEDGSVDYQLTSGDWIRLFRSNGLRIEDLIELRPPENAAMTYEGYAGTSRARDFPGEHIWKVRKATS